MSLSPVAKGVWFVFILSRCFIVIFLFFSIILLYLLAKIWFHLIASDLIVAEVNKPRKGKALKRLFGKPSSSKEGLVAVKFFCRDLGDLSEPDAAIPHPVMVSFFQMLTIQQQLND